MRKAAETIALRIWDGVRAVYPLLLLLVVWELVARAGLVRPLFLPPVSVVLERLYVTATDGELWPPLLTSLYRSAAGLVLAAAVGIPIGFLVVRNRFVAWFVDPLVAFGSPAPKLALIPVFTLWFGIDNLSKIMLVGARTVALNQIWAARAMGSSEATLLWRIVLRAALPSLMSGLRVAVPTALLTTFTAEMVAGGGLGGALIMAQRYFESATVYAYLLVMLICGYLFDVELLRLRRKVLHWYEG